jgi:hypothetical protein
MFKVSCSCFFGFSKFDTNKMLSQEYSSAATRFCLKDSAQMHHDAVQTLQYTEYDR